MKKILFTGARSGIINKVIDNIIGEYYIYITVHSESQLKAVLRKYRNINNVKCFKLDVTDTNDLKKLDDLDIDIVVLNSSIGYGGSIIDIDYDKVLENYDVNVFGNFNVIRHVCSKMIEKKEGKIILMSSLASIFPVPFLGVYSSTKASISNLGFVLNKELKYLSNKISVSVIEPGFYYTGFNQVMFNNKYDWMTCNSYFNEYIDKIVSRENFITNYIEKKNLNSIVCKIEKSIRSDNPRLVYRAPFSQSFLAKIYQFLFL